MSNVLELANQLVEAIDESDDYCLLVEQEPNSNVYWIKLHKMYDEDAEDVILTSTHGDGGLKMYQSAPPNSNIAKGNE